jgi:hypothetical protein
MLPRPIRTVYQEFSKAPVYRDCLTAHCPILDLSDSDRTDTNTDTDRPRSYHRIDTNTDSDSSTSYHRIDTDTEKAIPQ